MSPFDFLNSINDTKINLIVDDETEKEYSAYMVNRGLSYFIDTALLANEMNRNAHLDGKLQYDFLMSMVRKRKRFSKWDKPDTEEYLENVKTYYGYSAEKARSVIKLLSKDQLEHIRAVTTIRGKK